MNSNQPAGWYPDSSNPGYERYWNGGEWTSEIRQGSIQPPSGAIGQQPAPKKSGCFGIATGVMFGIFGGCVLLLGGCVALIAISAGDETGSVSVPTTPTDESGDGETEAPASGSEGSDDQAVEAAESDDIVSCTRTGEDEVVLEIVNNSSKTSTYSLTVGFFDDAGTRLADESAFVSDLRPGERAIESKFTFEESGSTCEVIDVDRFASESQAEELADVAACEITGEGVLGDVEAIISATNSSPNTSSYSISVAFVDADGVRRGDGDSFIEAVRPGESAPGDIFTTLDFVDGLKCEVVNADRTQSS